jgi:ribosomal protein L9
MREDSLRSKVTTSQVALQREGIQLSDKIAEANAHRVKLELDAEVAALVTGS